MDSATHTYVAFILSLWALDFLSRANHALCYVLIVCRRETYVSPLTLKSHVRHNTNGTFFIPLAVVLLNIQGFYTPLRDLVRTAVSSGFIRADNEDLLVFVDEPESSSESSEEFDWGKAALKAAQKWHAQKRGDPYQLKWDMDES